MRYTNHDKKFYPYFCKILPQLSASKYRKDRRYNDQ